MDQSSHPDPQPTSDGIDPELAPYLEAADRVDELDIVELSHDEDDAREALEALLSASMMAGPLGADIVAEQAIEVEEEDDPLEQAAADAVVAARVDAIYRGIIRRAPEHKFAPTLDRIKRILEWMGDPQLAYHTVHVAGTNGKTSTARMIDALGVARGYRTGRFTSPHLTSPRERISIDGAPISPEGFVRAWEDIAAFVDLVDAESVAKGGPKMSFFEVFTAMAFQAFADAPVDLGVIEVGMGGTWDCTNVLDSAVQVITPIAMDHEQWLGHTIEEIAANKAGIIRPGGIVIVGRQQPAALAVIEERAQQLGAQVRLLGRDIDVVAIEKAVGGSLISVRTPAALYEDLYVPLLGDYQADNAALAIAAFEALCGGGALDPALVERGLTSVTSPGRLELVRSSPTVLVDAAHNPHGAAALRRALEESFTFTHLVGVFAGMADKDTEGVLGEMEPILDAVVVTTLDTPRALTIDQAAAVATDVFGPDNVIAAPTLPEALDAAAGEVESSTDPTASTGIICFGSVVLAGAVRDLFGLAE
ncbi:MAG: folylpolyglutamate synthase/dihydrofolate synthase family protein [Actinomycetaceae bacterium]|nr:folylpolyglutamate synthase/dihydrofolate synthase family protein [Actinomycetaceae bacterium]MDU0970117.1 folylpolyglutamate synthase/dihydrofolate synthase family protein [Actinomycetaceae bacterium]